MAQPAGYSLDHVLVQYYQFEQARVAAQNALAAAAEAREAVANADQARYQLLEEPANDLQKKEAVNTKAIIAADKAKNAANKALAAVKAANAALEASQRAGEAGEEEPQVVAMAKAAAYEAFNAADQAQVAGRAAAKSGQGQDKHGDANFHVNAARQRVNEVRNQIPAQPQQAPEEQPDAFPTPILCLSRTADGVERLIVCQDKTQVPWYTRLLAFFGLGSASLNSVTAYLQRHRDEIHVFNQEAAPGNLILVDQAVQWINDKVIHRNEGSYIQHLDPLTLIFPVSLDEANCKGATSSTVPKDLEVDHTPPNRDGEVSDEFHNLDRFVVCPEKGIFVFGDATGHHEDRLKRVAIVDTMWGRIDTLVRELPPPPTFVEAARSLETMIKTVSREWLNAREQQVGRPAISSSLIIAWIVRDNQGQSYLIYAAVGDSDLYLLPQEGNLKQITPGRGPYRECEVGASCRSLLIDITPVNPGDTIFALSDGIHGHMANCVIEEIARNTDLEGLCPALTQAVMERPLGELVPDYEQVREGEYIPGEAACLDLDMERNPANAKKLYRPTNDDGSFNTHGCDDTGVVGMIVPGAD